MPKLLQKLSIYEKTTSKMVLAIKKMTFCYPNGLNLNKV